MTEEIFSATNLFHIVSGSVTQKVIRTLLEKFQFILVQNQENAIYYTEIFYGSIKCVYGPKETKKFIP